MTHDSSSNRSESSQLTAEGWCRNKLKRKNQILGQNLTLNPYWKERQGFLIHLLATVPWLRPDKETPALYFALPKTIKELQIDTSYQTVIKPILLISPELRVPLAARRDPRTLRREIVSTATHSLPQACTCKSVRCSTYIGLWAADISHVLLSVS